MNYVISFEKRKAVTSRFRFGIAGTCLALLLLTVCAVLAHASQPGRSEADLNVVLVGTWVSEPTLKQLGMIQSSYSFEEDSTYSLKLDFISFCDGAGRGIDCEYFWMIYEGSYAVQNDVITITSEKEKKVILRSGQVEPETTVSPIRPNSYEIQIKRQGENLLFRSSDDKEATLFKREN